MASASPAAKDTTVGVPVHDEDVERALIGAVLLDQAVLDAVADIVSASDFYLPAHRDIWSAALAVHLAGADVDIATVRAEMQVACTWERAGATSYLDTCSDAAPVVAHPEEYARIVAHLATRRRVGLCAAHLAAAVQDRQVTDDQIAEAIEDLRHVSEAERTELPSETMAELLGREWPTTNRWLVHGWWLRGACGLLAAWEKSSKSVLSLCMALAVASGRPFLGRWAVPEAGPVLVVAEEDHPREEQRRVRLLADALGISDRGLPIHFACQAGLKLSTRRGRASLAATVRRLRPLLVVLDPWRRLTPGVRENESDEVAEILDYLRRLQVETAASVLLVHHMRKLQPGMITRKGALRRFAHQIRGSSEFAGWYDSLVAILRVGDEDHRVTALHRSAGRAPEIGLRIRWDDAADTVSLELQDKPVDNRMEAM